MTTTSRTLLVTLLFLWSPGVSDAESNRSTLELPAAQLRDKIRGGLLGQILGNLNGLEHEMQYIDEPGSVDHYVPTLPDGARTDDDTDFEWVYVVEMQRQNTIYLSPDQIAQLWRTRINRRIWCSNQYARQLMDIGINPPLTGKFALNPWAEFNISGQFLCETFGLLAPGMPQTAGRIALNYTTVAIDLEPAQTTQFFTAMIATAFLEENVDLIIDAGLAAVDERSQLHEIADDLRRWHANHPGDWRATRRLLKEKYSRYGGAMRDRNGYELNTGATVAALLYGNGDFAATLRMAFNFGWDADNTAATAGTIVGVCKGYRWMMSQGWQIVDRYRNTTRDQMPEDETITSFADRLVDLAEKVIIDNGGRRKAGAQPIYLIVVESPQCVMRLPSVEEQAAELRRELSGDIEREIQDSANDVQRARAAYLAICLGLADQCQDEHPTQWRKALEALTNHSNVVQAIYYHADVPGGDEIRQRASSAGLRKPNAKEELW